MRVLKPYNLGSLLAHCGFDAMWRPAKPFQVIVFMIFFYVFVGIHVAGCGGVKPSETPDVEASPSSAGTPPKSTVSRRNAPSEDIDPPTAPSNLGIASKRIYQATDSLRCVYQLEWEPSSDDHTKTENITYQIISDGKVQSTVWGKTTFRFVVVGKSQHGQKVHVVAEDEAGNVSSASNFIDLPECVETSVSTPSPPTSKITRPTQTPPPPKTTPTSRVTRSDIVTRLDRGGRKPPQESENYPVKIDVNCHPDWPTRTPQSYECDRLGALFVDDPNSPKGTRFFLQRWNPHHLPIVYHIHRDSLAYRRQIEIVVDELNATAQEAGIQAKKNRTQCDDPSGPLLCLAGYPTSAPMEDYDTHTIRISPNEPDAYGASYTYASGYTGELLDNDIEIYMPAIEHLAKSAILFYRDRNLSESEIRDSKFKHTLMHELLHGFGFDHNLLGLQYKSLMKAPLTIYLEEEFQLSLSYEFNFVPGEDADFQTLRYLYLDDVYTTPEELPRFELQRYGHSSKQKIKPPA